MSFLFLHILVRPWDAPHHVSAGLPPSYAGGGSHAGAAVAGGEVIRRLVLFEVKAGAGIVDCGEFLDRCGRRGGGRRREEGRGRARGRGREEEEGRRGGRFGQTVRVRL
jgi:hypothetical protein